MTTPFPVWGCCRRVSCRGSSVALLRTTQLLVLWSSRSNSSSSGGWVGGWEGGTFWLCAGMKVVRWCPGRFLSSGLLAAHYTWASMAHRSRVTLSARRKEPDSLRFIDRHDAAASVRGDQGNRMWRDWKGWSDSVNPSLLTDAALTTDWMIETKKGGGDAVVFIIDS